MNNIVKFYPKDAAKNPDNVLEQAVGIYDQVLVIGYNKDGGLDVRSSLNFLIKDIFFAIDEFKFKVLNGEYGHRPEEKDTE
jgi:hypothetical protein